LQVNKTNLADYQYKLYSDYLNQLDGILTKYGQQTGLSIEYWHIRVDLSKNYDGVDSGDNVKMQNSFKHYIYDLYHFLPTINTTPLNYQIGFDQQRQGTSNVAIGSLSIYLLDKPLPGDLFRYYPFDGATDRTEIFRVSNVRYIRSSKNRLDLYQIDFETAPILVETLEHVRLNNIYCWDTERHLFLDEGPCNQMSCISDCRDKIIELINNWYDEQNGWYGLCLENSEYIVDWNSLCSDPDDPDCPTIDNPPIWPPGPGWPGWPDGPTTPGFPDPVPEPVKNCGGGSKTRPLVFLNTILKRLKKIFKSLDIQPIYGIGTAEIPIEWIIPYYTMDGPNGPEIMVRDYWDTFTCLSFQPEATSGELFNLTQILEGSCVDCPPELIQEIECHRELYTLVMSLVLLLKPLLTEEELKDNICDRKCCNQFNPEFVANCITMATGNQPDYKDLFWDASGPNAGQNAKSFCEKYENALCVPLYITWKDGAIWPNGGRVAG